MLLLAWKNTGLHFRKRLPVALFLVAAMALLFLGNSVFSSTDQGLESTYRNSLTGDLTISSRSEDPFTLFGSDLPLIGEYFKNPVLPLYDDVAYRLDREVPDARSLPVLIGAGKLSLDRFDQATPFFGAKLSDYFRFFPELKLVRGEVPTTSRPGLFLNDRLYQQVVEELQREPELGERFLFAAVLDSSFVLRELPFEGVFSYPVSDQLLDRVVLIDDDSARALNGYYGSTGEVAEETEDLLSKGSIDDLFSSGEDLTAVPQDGISLESVTEELKNRTGGGSVDHGTWNFILVRGEGLDRQSAVEGLQSTLDRDRIPVQVRNWRDSAGGNARIVWFLQWIFNVGLVFVSLVASLIVMNSLSLSVAERTREIGTMRALGAPRARIGRLIGYETVILVTGASLAGIGIGVATLWLISLTGGIAIDNPLLASLFGASQYTPGIAWDLVSVHAELGLILGVLSMVLPIQKALQVAPVQAMARE